MSVGQTPRVGSSDNAGPSKRVSAGGLFRASYPLSRDIDVRPRRGLFVLRVSRPLVIASWLSRTTRSDSTSAERSGTLRSAIRDGRSPYPQPIESAVEVGNPALYPPFLMLLVTPLTFLPWWLGLTVWTVIQAAAIVGALAILRVRDLRCYATRAALDPVLGGLTWGNATLLLVPLVALAWRWRDHWGRAGVVVGLAIASKLFVVAPPRLAGRHPPLSGGRPLPRRRPCRHRRCRGW